MSEDTVKIKVSMSLVGCETEIDTGMSVEEWNKMDFHSQTEDFLDLMSEVIDWVPVDSKGNIV